jgi:hypothetical protein
MGKDLNAPITRWKWMKLAEHRKPLIVIRPEDHVVSSQKTVRLILCFFLVGTFSE